MIHPRSIALMLAALLAACAPLAPTDPNLVSCSVNGRASYCAFVPLASQQDDLEAKTFRAPAAGKANIYVVRRYTFEHGRKYDVLLDGKAVGALAVRTYLVLEADPGLHEIVVQNGEEQPVQLKAEAGQVYYIEYTLPFSLSLRRGRLAITDEKEGQSLVRHSFRTLAAMPSSATLSK